MCLEGSARPAPLAMGLNTGVAGFPPPPHAEGLSVADQTVEERQALEKLEPAFLWDFSMTEDKISLGFPP